MTAQPLAQRAVDQHTPSPAAIDPEQLTVVRSRHPWRWVGAIIGLVLYGLIELVERRLITWKH